MIVFSVPILEAMITVAILLPQRLSQERRRRKCRLVTSLSKLWQPVLMCSVGWMSSLGGCTLLLSLNVGKTKLSLKTVSLNLQLRLYHKDPRWWARYSKYTIPTVTDQLKRDLINGASAISFSNRRFCPIARSAWRSIVLSVCLLACQIYNRFSWLLNTTTS